MSEELDIKDEKVEDTYDSLKLDEKEIEEMDKEEKESKKGKKEDDEKELELDDDKKKEEIEDFKDDELAVPPKRAEILKAYPDIFKKFPFFEGALRREQQFSEILGSVDDAKELVEKAKDYDSFSESLMKGDLTDVLKTVKENDPNAFGTAVDNILPTLSKVDNSAYTWLIGDVIRRSIISCVQESDRLGAESEEGKNLRAAAALFHKFMFGNTNLEKPSKFSGKKEDDKQVVDERNKLNEERAEILVDRYEDNLTTITDRVENTLRSTISEHIDPKDLMSPYVKKNAVGDAIDKLDELINEDTRFKSYIDRLWENAFDKNFDADSMKKIRSAFLGKAKTLLPSVIRTIRAEALKAGESRMENSETRPRNRDVSDKVDDGPKGPKNAPDKSGYKKGMDTSDYFAQD